MQRNVLLGAGAVVVAVAAFAALRSGGQHVAGKKLDQTLDQIIATLPPGTSATHGATDVNPLTGTVTVHDFAVSRDGKRLWSAETLSVSGADQQALHDVFDPAAYPEGHPAWTARRLLIADASASGVRIPAQAAHQPDLLVKSVTLHDLRGRPFILPPTRAHADDPAFRADAALAFMFQSLDESDIAFTSPPPKTNTFTIGSLTLHGYEGGRIGAAAARDVALDFAATKPGAPDIHATIGSIDIKTMDARAQLEKLRDQGVADKSSLNGLTYSSFDLAGLDVEVSPGPRISVTDMHASFPPAGADGAQRGDGRLAGFTVALKDTKLSAGPAAVIAAFGMNSLTMDGDGSSNFTTAPPHMEVSENVAFHDLGTLHLTIGLADYDRAAFQRDAKIAILTAPIDHATLSWKDAGLVNRALAAAAEQMHTTPDVVRTQLAMPLVTLGLLMPDQPDATDQVTAFINHPGTLTITLNPPDKTTLLALATTPAQNRAHVLGARVQAK